MVRDHFIEITGVCNLKCCHCYRKYEDSKNVSVDDIIKNALTIDSQNLLITGGEALLHPNIDEILTRLKKTGKKIILLSNGALVAKFEDLIVKCVDVLNVSLDWPDERHDINRGMKNLFGIIKENLARLKQRKNRPKINLLVTMFKENNSCIPELVKVAEKISDAIVFDRYIQYGDYPTMLSPKEANDTYKLLHELKKNSAASIIVYDPIYYTLYPKEGTSRERCRQRLFTSNQNQRTLCPFYPVKYSSITEVINERSNEPLPIDCKECEYSATCHGGCPATRLAINKDLSKKDIYCIK